jgi:hypothetical protein
MRLIAPGVDDPNLDPKKLSLIAKCYIGNELSKYPLDDGVELLEKSYK